MIVCPPSVESNIEGGLTIKSILDWVFTNTVRTTERGVVGWAHHGLWHAQRKGERWNDNWSIKSMYSNPIKLADVETIVSKMLFSDVYQPENKVEGAQEKCDLIMDSISSFAFDLEMISSTADEQCERELQIEVEEEHKESKQVIKVSPMEESPWDYEDIVSCQTIGELDSLVKLYRLSSGIKAFCAIDGIDKVAWESSGCVPIYGTENFFRTVKLNNDGDKKNQCLRPVDVVVVLKGSVIVLLSDREADGILSALLDIPPDSVNIRLLSICRLPKRLGVEEYLSSSIPMSIGRIIMPPVYNCASIRLFNGETQFEGAVSELNGLVSKKEAREAAKLLVQVRGRLKLYSKSDLQRSCDRIR